MAGDGYRRRLKAEKARSTVQVLLKAARLLSERAIARVRARSGLAVRAAHTALLPHIDLEGTRLTEIARRLGVTKQAAGQLVDEVVAMGMLERVPDPEDARAKLVRFTKRGQKALLDGIEVLDEIGGEVRALVGASRMKALHDALAAIVAEEESRGAP